jgi:cytochrome c-type biogenesis protein CcmH/NrfG
MAPLAVRAVLIVLAAACVAVAVGGLRHDHACTEARAAGRWRAVAAHCGDPRDRAQTAALLASKGRRTEALALARRMVRDSPQDYLGWLALGRLGGDGHALARAHALNPRGVPPPARRR